MIRILKKEDCCGCTACYSSCPTSAISMKPDDEGFKYPVIDLDKCVNCGLCDKVCPMQSSAKNRQQKYGAVYAIQNKNEEARFESTAGGFFSVIADKILAGGGYVCAAGWQGSSHIVVTHKIIHDYFGLSEMRGSKYVQSDLNDVYSEIKTLVKQGKRCLFVGTPCQVNGIRKAIGFSPLLITIDLLCLGVSSPKIFDMWMEYLEEKYKDHVSIVLFRDKSFGYSTANVRVQFETGRKLEQKYDAKVYLKTFFNGYNVRPSCYDCKFRSAARVSDFTIGDYHQIAQVNKEMDDDKGTTIVWINSKEGTEIFDDIKDRITYYLIEKHHDGVVGKVTKLTKIPDDREIFYYDVNQQSFKVLIKKWVPNNIRDRLVNIMKPIINKTPFSTMVFKAIKSRKQKAFEERVKIANQ